MLLASACNQSFKSEQEFYKWLNDHDNGLITTRTTGSIKISVKYLAPEFLAYRELKQTNNYTRELKDSIVNVYKNSLTFLLAIGPDESKEDFDIMTTGVENIVEFNERVKKLNFEIGQFITLKTENGEYKPVLSTLENVYGLTNKRNIYIVFAPNEESKKLLCAQKLDLVFEDDIFLTGINHFKFDKKKLDNIPHINFWKY